VEWISRDLSGVADELSRIKDSNEYKFGRNGTLTKRGMLRGFVANSLRIQPYDGS